MAANEILPFAQAGGANVLSQAAYSADAQRGIGNQPGVARADFNNKALLQATAIVAGIAQFMADRQTANVTDALSAATLASMLQASMRVGGYAGVVVRNASIGVLAADVGKLNECTAGAAITLTMPAVSTALDGETHEFVNHGLGVATVARAGTDVIQVNNTSVTSIPVKYGENLRLTRTAAGVWTATGSAMAKYRANWAAQLAANGYTQLPSGVIVQMGSGNTGGGTSTVVTFPIAFLSACRTVVAGNATSSVAGNVIASTGFTTTQFTASSNVAAFGFTWIAIGD